MFYGVDLEDSWVLGWHFNSSQNQLVFDLEFSLWQGNKHYETPLHGEYTCYKRGCLIFDEITSIHDLLPMNAVKPTIDPDGSIDYGNIEGLRHIGEGIYKFGGNVAKDFGEVSVKCGYVRLEISQRPQ